MKRLLFAMALVGSAATASAFAQTPAQPANGSAQVAPHDDPVQYEHPNTQKTRAQVYQELVQAERDGEFADLNSTVYAHP